MGNEILYGVLGKPLFGKLGKPVYSDMNMAREYIYISYEVTSPPGGAPYYYLNIDIGLGWHLGTGNRGDALSSWGMRQPFQTDPVYLSFKLLEAQKTIVPVSFDGSVTDYYTGSRKIDLSNVIAKEYGKGNDGVNNYYDIFLRCGTLVSDDENSDPRATNPSEPGYYGRIKARTFKFTVIHKGARTHKNYTPSVIHVPNANLLTSYPVENLVFKMRWIPATQTLSFIEL